MVKKSGYNGPRNSRIKRQRARRRKKMMIRAGAAALCLAAVIGAMGMKAGAYLQPLVHRISGGKEPEASAQADTSDNDRPGIS